LIASVKNPTYGNDNEYALPKIRYNQDGYAVIFDHSKPWSITALAVLAAYIRNE
jgi:hypothetical protein